MTKSIETCRNPTQKNAVWKKRRKLASQFATRMWELCEECRRLEQVTDWRSEHRGAQEFVRKMVSVRRSRERNRIFDAFTLCERAAKGDD